MNTEQLNTVVIVAEDQELKNKIGYNYQTNPELALVYYSLKENISISSENMHTDT